MLPLVIMTFSKVDLGWCMCLKASVEVVSLWQPIIVLNWNLGGDALKQIFYMF